MRKNVIFFSLFFLIFSFNSRAQQYFWVAFKNKNGTKFSLSAPEAYLSERAIQRRVKQNIPIDSLDLPVNSNYIDSVLNLGAQFVHSSKWLNGITVKTEIDSFLNVASKIPFVKEVQLTKPAASTKSAFNKFNEPEEGEKVPIDSLLYGESVYQTGLMNGQFLHNKGMNGQGVQIAVIDAGFLNADFYPAFDSLWANNQILGIKDFVNPNDDFYTTHYHGMSVLSCMGGNIPGELIGTARKASYWLIRSEDVSSEYLIEEDNWVAAAEFADSVGADIINSSLGYYEFDDPDMNHTYADMDGKTTRVAQGANIAFSRGMLVVVAAGNEGNNTWRYIISPADGDHVLAVGATNKFGFAATFTSFGPASDGDVKPNVAAVGSNTYLQRSNGNLGFSSGTSFASPIMAGMAACLWQAAPNAKAAEIKAAIEESASQYSSPDSILGYGIPDFFLAWDYFFPLSVPGYLSGQEWLAYPNPVTDFVMIQKNGSSNRGNLKIELYTSQGHLIRQWEKPDQRKIILSGLGELPGGILLLKISSTENSQTVKLNLIH